MFTNVDESIAAIASAAGIGTRGIVRISGRDCISRIQGLFGTELQLNSKRPFWTYAKLALPLPFPAVDARVLVWPTNRSFTRQPAVEIHTYASAPLLDAILNRLRQLGVRAARPGEFTLRAFLAGRIDLTQAEAILGVIDAETTSELLAALNQLGGGLGAKFNSLRNEILDVLAHLEAGLDFVEEDIEFITKEELVNSVEKGRKSVLESLERMSNRGISGRAPKVVLVGSPNVGKSSLINALAGKEVAVVSNQAGTTRDYVSTCAEIQGLRVELIDTAGIDRKWAELSEVDRLAQLVTDEQIQQGDLLLLCYDLKSQDLIATLQNRFADQKKTFILVRTKCDLAAVSDSNDHEPSNDSTQVEVFSVSSLTGVGLSNLKEHIRSRLAGNARDQLEGIPLTWARAQEALNDALQALDAAIDLARHEMGEELVAAELRVALEHIGHIVGTVYNDDVLDRVFSRFCIGK